MQHFLILALLAQAPAVEPAPAAKTPDACALLGDADVQRVLGLTVQERRPGTQQAHGLLLSQCYLGTGTARSVSIAIAANTSSGGRTITPRAFWREQFHGRDERASERKGERDEAPRVETREPEGESEARPISGIGDEAFWSGSRVAGALYVLRGDTFIRVSVGGIGEESKRIETSRQLAVTALARLRASTPPKRKTGHAPERMSRWSDRSSPRD